MPKLLHEYWEGDRGDEFGPVREENDHSRKERMTNPRLVFSLTASSWLEALRLRDERLGYGQLPNDMPDHVYTDEEGREQQEYMKRRGV